MSQKRKPFLTVGMLTHQDFGGVWATTMNIVANSPELLDDIHFTIVDNDPESHSGGLVRKHAKDLGIADYHTISSEVTASTFKNCVFEFARTEHILCVDGHVTLLPDALRKLIAFYRENPDFHDLIQGPLYNCQRRLMATEMLPGWRGRNFGTWHKRVDTKNFDPCGEAFEIPLHGMGLFACTRHGWPRFTPGLRGFGGEEGVIHEAFRLTGRKAWNFPFLGWIHRFGRDINPKYEITGKRKVSNNLAAFRNVHLPLDSIDSYFRYKLGFKTKAEADAYMDGMLKWAKSLPESPFKKPPASYQPFLGEAIKLHD